MASKVFTETMNHTDPEDTKGSIRTIDRYIRYMTERVEFAIKSVFKVASEAGSSSAEVLNAIRILQDSVSTLSSSVSRLQGDVTRAQGDIVALQDAVGNETDGLVKAVADINAAIGDDQTSGTILYQLKDLDARVSALENPSQQNT